MKKKTYRTKCESLDLVKAIHRKRVYPLMYCQMEICGHVNINRLRKAVELSYKYVPEILYTFDFRRYCFVNIGLNASNVIVYEKYNKSFSEIWDLSKDTQLKIFVRKESKIDVVTIGMSHILTDGAGFLQYLYLLAALYNGQQIKDNLKNNRNISYILKGIHIQTQTEQTKYEKRIVISPLRPYSEEKRVIRLSKIIESNDLNNIRTKAKKRGATLNDVFITAYARVIAELQNVDKVVIPCPADLRRFLPNTDDFTVANMTGMYRRITIEILPGHDFDTTLFQVHLETELQKSHFRCFEGIRALEFVFRKIPYCILSGVIKRNYHLLPVSYTNIGVIDDKKLFFDDCKINNCYLTGAFRCPPDFQLSVSTFQNVCTLSCALIGTPKDRVTGETILKRVRKEIMDWIC